MQFDRQPDGELKPLPKPSVDTGMGLERISAVMQHVHSNYEIDLFQALIKRVAELTHTGNLEEKSLRVIADHIRASAFLVADGVVPSNEGRGYVLRRIIRRALRHGHKLGQAQPFFYRLVEALAGQMGDAYPELNSQRARIEKVLLAEEEQFARTLADGMKVLEAAIADLDGTVIPGEVVFTLYDTHGFPTDLTNDVARERDLTLDMEGFEREMEAQRARSRGADTFAADYSDRLQIEARSDFRGYECLNEDAQVVALYRNGEEVESLAAGDEGMVVLDRTPFYAESGGQVGDTGSLASDTSRFLVSDTRKRNKAFVHLGKVEQGILKKDDHVSAAVDAERRAAIMRNHSATHLMHAALRRVLGEHVAQKGSLVNAEYLRFDFSHTESVTPEQIEEVEALVNRQILANVPVTTELMDIESAKKAGAVALFGEKYEEHVRVLSMGEDNFSMELCGGTHVGRTGDIGFFRVTSEGASSSGVRRIEAVTGLRALDAMRELEQRVDKAAALLRTAPDQLVGRVEQTLARVRELEKEVERLKQKLASGSGSDLSSEARDIAGVRVLATRLDDMDGKTLRTTMDRLKDKLGSAVILLAGVQDDKVSLVAGVTKDLTDRFNAGELIRDVSSRIGGKGGGRPDMAQGGGTDVTALDDALATIEDWVQTRA